MRPFLAVVLSLILGGCGLPENPASPEEKPTKQTCEWRPFGKILVKDCQTKTPTLPERCRHLLRDEPDPATWDSAKGEYPPNREWEDCMGVGRK